MLLRYINIALAPGLTNLHRKFFSAGIQNPISVSHNRLGSDTLWAGLGSGREVRPAQCVAIQGWITSQKLYFCYNKSTFPFNNGR